MQSTLGVGGACAGGARRQLAPQRQGAPRQRSHDNSSPPETRVVHSNLGEPLAFAQDAERRGHSLQSGSERAGLLK